MKNIFKLSVYFLLTVSPLLAWESPKTLKPEYYQYSESDFWANLWLGYSFCALDEIRNSSTAWNSNFSGQGTSSTHPNLDALNLGLEGGWLMDGVNGFSLSVENIEVPQSSYDFSAPPVHINSVIQPNAYSLSLNFYRFIDQKKDAQTYICLGTGCYLSSVSFVQNLYNNGNLNAWSRGYWEGFALGGTMGAGARINAGKNFGIQLDARGRYASFSKVTTNYTDYTGKNSYMSALAVNGNGIIIEEPDGNVGTAGNQDRFLVVDYSGFDLNIGVFYHF